MCTEYTAIATLMKRSVVKLLVNSLCNEAAAVQVMSSTCGPRLSCLPSQAIQGLLDTGRSEGVHGVLFPDVKCLDFGSRDKRGNWSEQPPTKLAKHCVTPYYIGTRQVVLMLFRDFIFCELGAFQMVA